MCLIIIIIIIILIAPKVYKTRGLKTEDETGRILFRYIDSQSIVQKNRIKRCIATEVRWNKFYYYYYY